MFSPPKLTCILVPNLPIQVERERCPPDVPLIVSHPIERDRVMAASDDAAAAGVWVGMALHQARQATPAALVVDANEADYHLRHDAVANALLAYTPNLETVTLGEFLVGARGFNQNDRAPALEQGAAAHAASGLMVQVGLAMGRFTAQQAARLAPPGNSIVVPPGQEATVLSPLPLTVLPDLPGEALRRLQLLDIFTLGQLTALKKAAIQPQFDAEVWGPQMAWLYDLAQGHDSRPPNPDMLPLRVIRTFILSEPMADKQLLVNAIGRLSERIGQSLARHGYQAEALKLSALDVDGQEQHTGKSVRPPTADEARFARLTVHLMGELVLHTPIVSLTLSAYPLRHWPQPNTCVTRGHKGET